MKTNFSQAALVAIFAAFCVSTIAAERESQVAWPDLARHVTGKRISTVLTDGTNIHGRVLAVRAEVLVVQVTHTSDPARFKSSADIPRKLVSSLRVSTKGWIGRVIGPIAGFVGGGLLAVAVTNHGDDKYLTGGKLAIGGVMMFGGAGLGYYIGSRADRHTQTIQIIP